MFRIAERLLYFDIFRVRFNEFEDNFVFVCNFSGKLPLFYYELNISSPSSLKCSENIYYQERVNPSSLE